MNDGTEKHEESLRSLIDGVVNGEASPEQRRQLEERLLEDEQARDIYLNYTNLHSSLSRWFLSSDSAEALEDDIADVALPMSRDGMKNSSASRSRVGWTGLIVTVCLLFAVGLYQLPWLRALVQRPAAEGPTIVQVAGDVHVQSADGSSAEASESRVLGIGESAIISGDEGMLALRYADGTEVVLLGSSTLRIDDSPNGAKRLKLKTGLLRADVAPQSTHTPMLIVTPQARVRVLGTRFELVANEQSGTRLELESGRVELVRGDDRPLEVEPNSIAIVPTTPEPIHVSRRPAVIDAPRREMVFRGLKSLGFAEDGKTLIAATRWQVLYWDEDDRLEVIPFNDHGRQGISLRRQVDSLLAYFNQHDQKLILWDAQSRLPLHEFENIADLKRQFRDFANRPPSWNPASHVAAMSPQGDWLACQVGREFRIWRADQNHWPTFPRNYDGKFVGALAASPDGKALAVAVRRGKADLIHMKTGEVTTTWSLQHEVPFAMDFSADGKFLAVALAGHVAIHDVASGKVLADFEQPGLSFLKVALSTDGRFVAASSLGERVWIWDVTNGADLPLLDVGGPIHDLAFAPSGDQLAVLSRGGRLTIWEVKESEAPISKSDSNSK